jgi:hypothetical protein
MNANGSIVIPFSKRKLSKQLVISIVFVALGCFMLSTPSGEDPGLFRHPLIKNGTAIGCLLLGLCGMLVFISKLFNKRPGIVIDDHGMTDNSSLVSAGHIPWSDVHLISHTTVMNQKMLLLIVKNPEDYVRRKKSIIGQRGMRWNHKNCGSPICIAVSGLQCTLGELERLIEEKLSAYKSQGPVRII